MSVSHSTLQQFFLQVSPLRAGKRLDPENFLKFPQYVGFSAYLIVKAGSS